MNRRMFVVLRVQDFEFEPSPQNRFHLPFPVEVDKGKMVGYLPVYANADDALADFPNAKLSLIKEVNNDNQV